MSLVSQVLDYSPKAITTPSYSMNRIYQTTGATSVVLSTSTTESNFEIPPNKVINLSRSVLSYSVDVTATTGGVYTNLFMNVPNISGVQLTTRSGTYLCDIRNADKFMRVVLPRVNKLTDLLSNDSGDTAATSGADLSVNKFCQASDTLAAAAIGDNHAKSSARVVAGGLLTGIPSKSYTEQCYLKQSVINGAIGYNVEIDLGSFVHSILAEDKDLFFDNEVLNLRILWTPYTALGYSSAIDGSSPTALSAGASISNLNLYVAVEQNEEIANSLISKVKSSGLQLVVPYVHTVKQTVGVSTSNTFSQKLNRSHGSSLLRAYFSVFHATESSSTQYDISNVGSAKIFDWYSMLNSNRMEQFTANCALNQDYLTQKEMLEHSCIQNSNIQKYNQCIIKDWTGMKCVEYKKTDSVQNGLSLQDEQQLAFVLTTPSIASVQYAFFVCQKVLQIGGGQISMM